MIASRPDTDRPACVKVHLDSNASIAEFLARLLEVLEDRRRPLSAAALRFTIAIFRMETHPAPRHGPVSRH